MRTKYAYLILLIVAAVLLFAAALAGMCIFRIVPFWQTPSAQEQQTYHLIVVRTDSLSNQPLTFLGMTSVYISREDNSLSVIADQTNVMTAPDADIATFRSPAQLVRYLERSQVTEEADAFLVVDSEWLNTFYSIYEKYKNHPDSSMDIQICEILPLLTEPEWDMLFASETGNNYQNPSIFQTMKELTRPFDNCYYEYNGDSTAGVNDGN